MLSYSHSLGTDCSAFVPTIWTTAARTIPFVPATARWTVIATGWRSIALAFPIDGILDCSNIYPNMEFSVRRLLAGVRFDGIRDIESLSTSITNADELKIAGLENNDGTIYPCRLGPCLGEISNQHYGSPEVWNVSLHVERTTVRTSRGYLCRMGRRQLGRYVRRRRLRYRPHLAPFLLPSPSPSLFRFPLDK